jgi:tetratricopeptide (TPR) repeat protein
VAIERVRVLYVIHMMIARNNGAWDVERRGTRGLGVDASKILLTLLTLLCAFVLTACGDRLDEAHRLEAAGDWAGAVEAYEQVLSASPDDMGALAGAAVDLMVLQRYDEALELQERVVAADAGDVETRVELGFNYLSHQGRPADAVRVLQEAVDLEPTAKNLTFLAQAQRQVGDEPGAEVSLRRAIEVDSTFAYAYTQLGSLLDEQGRTVEAAQVRRQGEASSVGDNVAP